MDRCHGVWQRANRNLMVDCREYPISDRLSSIDHPRRKIDHRTGIQTSEFCRDYRRLVVSHHVPGHQTCKNVLEIGSESERKLIELSCTLNQREFCR